MFVEKPCVFSFRVIDGVHHLHIEFIDFSLITYLCFDKVIFFAFIISFLLRFFIFGVVFL